MSHVNELLSQRTSGKSDKKSASLSKMAEMARQSSSGHLTSFSGVFSVSELSNKEKEDLEALLKAYAGPSDDSDQLASDLTLLISITSEVKAINNQAALLHGERIKKAHQILTRYRDGAFTEWLKTTYGNRQTPYNFLQYFEFYHSLALPYRLRLEEMPRQAIYTLASRNAPLEQKHLLIENYQGETKAVLLEMIRRQFPLEKSDNRRENIGEKAIKGLEKICSLLQEEASSLTFEQKMTLERLLSQIQKSIGKKANSRRAMQ